MVHCRVDKFGEKNFLRIGENVCRRDASVGWVILGVINSNKIYIKNRTEV